jgi:hypothetical protein
MGPITSNNHQARTANARKIVRILYVLVAALVVQWAMQDRFLQFVGPGTIWASRLGTRTEPRIPKRSPHHVYQCGYQDYFVNMEANLAKAVFPEVNVTHLESLQGVVFQEDDILIYGCFGPCPINIDDMAAVFPGTILTINGESTRGRCAIGPRAGAENRIFPLDHIDNDPSQLNASTFYVGMILASRPAAVRETLFVPSKRAVNTGEHFLIYANSNCVSYREEAFRQLAKIGLVHYGGGCNGGGGVGERSEEVLNGRFWWTNKDLFGKYRFTLAMENTATDGYITEKILASFLAGSIPIYFGTEQVFELFNSKAFIWYDINNPQEALDRVAYLESNVTAYKEMFHEPILAHGEETIARYFSFRDSEGGGRLKWAIRERIGFG